MPTSSSQRGWNRRGVRYEAIKTGFYGEFARYSFLPTINSQISLPVDERPYLRGGKKVFLIINPGEDCTEG